MKNFTQAYDKSREVIKRKGFSKGWQKYLDKEVMPSSLLAGDGPSTTFAGGLDKLRNKIDKPKVGFFKKLFYGNVENGKTAGDTILLASANSKKRAATLKFLKHFYLSSKRGGQNVWIYSPPVAYKVWVYDHITGAPLVRSTKLNESAEVYSAKEKGIMCDALLLALNWSQNVVAKLGSPSDDTKAMVRRWFADEDTTDQQITAAITKLSEGFKKVSNVANSSKLIFSDEPLDRARGGWKDWAFVYSSESQEVLYLQGAFLKAGNSGKLWICALTIIHEITHRAVKTDDHRYDTSGLKPAKATLPYAKAINNADSWSYFATDLAGKLSASDRKKVLV
ncbi:MAG: M35 family metallo-endopeptidase [Candidatus Sedimenticola sp. (ex Thyasira tokunagai)]